MRWDNLFDDLESQLETELTAEDIDLQAEEERLRLGRLSTRDRIAAILESAGAAAADPIRLVLASGVTIAVSPVTLGKDWVATEYVGDSSKRGQCIIPLATISGLILERSQVRRSLRMPPGGDPARGLSARLSLVFVLRDLCRRRRAIDIELPNVERALHGTIDRVGRDHLDLAVHERGVPRRESEVNHYRLVPLGQIQLIRL